MNLLIRVWLFATSWTVAHQVSLSMGFSMARVLEWIAISFAKGILPTQGLNPGLLHCRQMLYRLSQMLNSIYKINIFKNTVEKTMEAKFH